MATATEQSMCLLSACQSGLITVAKVYPNISEQLKDMIIKAHNMISDAVGTWSKHKASKKRVDKMLSDWHDRMTSEGYGDENNMTCMVALSKLALDELVEKVRDPVKRGLIEPVIEILDDISGLLQEGCKGYLVEPKLVRAEVLLLFLFEACGFEPV